MPTDLNDPQRKIRHLLILEDLDGFRLVPLEESSYFLGRDVTNSIVVRSQGISRQHALFLRVTNADPNSYGFMLIDGNLQGEPSTNGTAVNGEKCASTKLNHGDRIVFGRQMKAKYLVLGALTDLEFGDFCKTSILKKPSPEILILGKPLSMKGMSLPASPPHHWFDWPLSLRFCLAPCLKSILKEI